MASGTSSRANALPELQTLFDLAAGSATPLPLLVLRLPEFERIAWREGKRQARRLERKAIAAFRTAAGSVLRADDLCAHDPGSDLFAVLVAGTRRSSPAGALSCRAMLERIGSHLAAQLEMRVETGWAFYDRGASGAYAIASALERGARERERYEFFSAIGHELRTPLSSIRGYLETLIDEPLNEETRRRFLETAQREALRMGRLLDGMFEFSLLDLSRVGLAEAVCDLREQIARACEVVAPLARDRGVSCEIDELKAELEIALDADACLQLLVNLLENATKYSHAGGCVCISAHARDGDAVIWVDDDGPGIPHDLRDAIFSLRVRGSQCADRPGTGIGLAIVKLIAERSGGNVRADDSPLGGARFEVVLPLKADFRTMPS